MCRGPVPISCTELRVQVGATKLYGLSQLLLLAAAAKQPRPPQHARPSAQGAPAGAQGAERTQAVDGDRQHSKAPARSVLLAVAAMPEKVGGHKWARSTAACSWLRCAPLGASCVLSLFGFMCKLAC
jgi:hypothetical protein